MIRIMLAILIAAAIVGCSHNATLRDGCKREFVRYVTAWTGTTAIQIPMYETKCDDVGGKQ